MKSIPRIPITFNTRTFLGLTGVRVPIPSRHIHSSAAKAAVAHPINVRGPPPKPPAPSPEFVSRIERRKKQSDLIQQGNVTDSGQGSASSKPLKRRFWKDVHVKEVDDGYQIFLDSRAVRTPAKKILTIPASKPHLAHAIALEWDLLVSAQQALKQHLIPLTSLTARAQDIVVEDAAGQNTIRNQITKATMRYLDTDTLLSWAPEKSIHDPDVHDLNGEEKSEKSLRDLQIRTARPIIDFLTAKVWPGIEIRPALEENSIMPTPQLPLTKEVIRGWIYGLPAYELAGLERGVLASRSLLVAARFVIEWSEQFRHLQPEERREFGIEQAAAASTLEVTWQTDKWGEVEDTHDVDREDVRRQLGSVVLLVGGEQR
ncbi:ATP synthase mitochondrial F1 complex assembly factor 2 [Histoplasma capsulatum G186AR]|uniref:ATP synthase mitochondrial F1 complex assembly factor 2 n=2 Tax=Ajellomyces capsulatus TaxID=5037 RepID=C0NAZ5_AJECG|nr:ATP synthase mitochondrial F1 complex assembly factor 2 [Histoplasma capsulatum G186AR]EEH10836.1 ATP synthase mitochondrial F1 complex assembly factor 2 [Histoplasma capsulatum G186AR]KAG5288712.1 ATP synthase mitochondrial F1 complex assembly factor 2 [Histoplasma capsulatum]QSS71288.1 ATP synthase mitochondrial F1 complex assembly factor 2 [Histoplasma capsulatum G186AR]